MTLADVVRDLRTYDEDEVSWQAPTIYCAEPWLAHSEALVTWSMPKGGLPEPARKRRLVRLIEVRAALHVLGSRYDQFVSTNLDELCAVLIEHVTRANAVGRRYATSTPESK